MKLWDNFRNYFYKKSLLKKIQQIKVERAITNLNDAKSIGIVYDSSNSDNDIIITKFAETLRNQKKTVEILAFVNDTKTEHKADVLVFNKKSLTWLMIPKNEQVEKFAEKKFDLLLASFTEENLPLEYVAAISQAKWRLGTYAKDKTDFYDMMISLGGRNELSYFLEQTTHFLNQVKYDS